MAYRIEEGPVGYTNVLGGLVQKVETTVRRIGEFYAERGRVAQLAALDARGLKDIGLSVGEIRSAAHQPDDVTRRRRGIA